MVVLLLLLLVTGADALVARAPPHHPPLRARTTKALPEGSLDSGTVAVVVVAGTVVIVGASALIGSAYEGAARGLGAFLQDGGGFSKSIYDDKAKQTRSRALDGVKLPFSFDFVDEYGAKEIDPVAEAEALRQDLAAALAAGDAAESKRLQTQLEALVKRTGLVFETDE